MTIGRAISSNSFAERPCGAAFDANFDEGVSRIPRCVDPFGMAIGGVFRNSPPPPVAVSLAGPTMRNTDMLRTRFNEALKESMRAKDTRAVSTIRMILAGLKDRDIAARSRGVTDGIDEAEILSMLQGLIKQRNESATMYDQGGRPELAQQEREEIIVIEGFLPKQMGEDEVRAAISSIVAELGASSIKDMGRVMAELKARHAGQMDFAKAGGLVKQTLSGN